MATVLLSLVKRRFLGFDHGFDEGGIVLMFEQSLRGVWV